MEYSLFHRKLSLTPRPTDPIKDDNNEKKGLVLTRHKGEKIIIDVDGEIIEVILSDIIDNRTRILVRASKRVKVDREEVYLSKLSNKINPSF